VLLELIGKFLALTVLGVLQVVAEQVDVLRAVAETLCSEHILEERHLRKEASDRPMASWFTLVRLHLQVLLQCSDCLSLHPSYQIIAVGVFAMVGWI